MKIVLIALMAAALAGCGNNKKPETPSGKAVDSAILSAPDTIKAIAPDTARKDSARKDSARKDSEKR